MIHLLTTDYPTTPQKNHSLIPPVQFGEGKGKWALRINKMQNLLLLNHDTSVQSLHASGLDVAQPQNNRAVHTPRSCKWEWKTKGSRWKSSRKGGSETAQTMDSALSLLLSGSVSSSSCFSHASLNSFGRWISLWTCPLKHVSHYFHILSFSKSQMSLVGWQPAEGEQGCLLHSAFIRKPYLCSASELSKAESGSFFSGKSQRVACSPQQPAASMF